VIAARRVPRNIGRLIRRLPCQAVIR
jgi:hypothetical protein